MRSGNINSEFITLCEQRLMSCTCICQSTLTHQRFCLEYLQTSQCNCSDKFSEPLDSDEDPAALHFWLMMRRYGSTKLSKALLRLSAHDGTIDLERWWQPENDQCLRCAFTLHVSFFLPRAAGANQMSVNSRVESLPLVHTQLLCPRKLDIPLLSHGFN